MQLKYLTRDYAARLDHSMCRINGQAVYLVVQGDVIHYRTSPSSEYIRLHSHDIHMLDIASIPLGYLNNTETGKVNYIMRRPVRSYKQGVSDRNIIHRKIDGGHTGSYHEPVCSDAFFDMVNNRYPSLDDAMTNTGVFQTAISRNVAISQNELGVKNVYFKTDLIGWMKPENDTVIVQNSAKGMLVEKYLGAFEWKIKKGKS